MSKHLRSEVKARSNLFECDKPPPTLINISTRIPCHAVPLNPETIKNLGQSTFTTYERCVDECNKRKPRIPIVNLKEIINFLDVDDLKKVEKLLTSAAGKRPLLATEYPIEFKEWREKKEIKQSIEDALRPLVAREIPLWYTTEIIGLLDSLIRIIQNPRTSAVDVIPIWRRFIDLQSSVMAIMEPSGALKKEKLLELLRAINSRGWKIDPFTNKIELLGYFSDADFANELFKMLNLAKLTPTELGYFWEIKKPGWGWEQSLLSIGHFPLESLGSLEISSCDPYYYCCTAVTGLLDMFQKLLSGKLMANFFEEQKDSIASSIPFLVQLKTECEKRAEEEKETLTEAYREGKEGRESQEEESEEEGEEI